jgi:hypothetical protein
MRQCIFHHALLCCRYHVAVSYNASTRNVSLLLNGIAIPRYIRADSTPSPAELATLTKVYIGR